MEQKWLRLLGFGGAGSFVFGLSLFQFIMLNEGRTLDPVVSAGVALMAVGGVMVLAMRALR